MRFAFLAIVAVTLLMPGILFAQGTLYTIQENGPQDLRINIVIFAEGYTATQEADFVTDANDMYAYLLGISPWSQYASYLNGYAIFVASNESGADDPSASIFVDTYFSSTFDSYGIARLLTIPPNDFDGDYDHGYGRVYDLLATHLPAYDVILVLANDPQYGGSGGTIAVSSLNISAPEIVVHELGHSFAGLADEYDYGGVASQANNLHATVPENPGHESHHTATPLGDELLSPFASFFAGGAPNVTTETVRELIKWNIWILPSTPIPTPETNPYNSVVGLFEGANYQPTGWYRPRRNCKMNTLGPAYCQVCAETHVLANYNLVSPIDSAVPGIPTIPMDISDAETLSVVTKLPTTPLRIRWYEDEVELGNTTPNAIFLGSELGVGSHAIKCVVTDTSLLVRNDPFQLLGDAFTWTLDVTCTCACHADPQCDGITTILDVAHSINVAFRSVPPSTTGVCAYENTDMDCTGATDVLDVVKVTNVAFRNANPATEFCHPCP